MALAVPHAAKRDCHVPVLGTHRLQHMAEQQLALTLRWARELPVVDMTCCSGWITELGGPTKDGGLAFKVALPARPGEHAPAQV